MSINELRDELDSIEREIDEIQTDAYYDAHSDDQVLMLEQRARKIRLQIREMEKTK